MTDWVHSALLIAAAIGSGLIGGLFFAFSTFIMRALARLPDAHGMAAMQSINVTVLNPLFFLAFFGTAVASLVLAVISVLSWSGPGALTAFAAALIYLVGSIGVTIAGNVPLNEKLARSGTNDASASAQWQHYLRVWTGWNHVRTVASLVSAVLFTLAALA